MSWGTVTIGGISLRETVTAEQAGDALSIAGQESHPPSTLAHVEAVHHNINQLVGLAVPVTFTDKEGLSGFYRVINARSVLVRELLGAVQTADWFVDLERIGADRDVEIESRVPSIARTDQLTGTQTAVFWHAPAVGVTSYWTGPTVPSGSVSRASSDGTVTVHTGLPADVAPRWTVPVADYLAGSARILIDGARQVGTHSPAHTWWRMHNGIVQVSREPNGEVAVSAWDGDDWRSDGSYRFQVNAGNLTDRPELSILHNTPEMCAIRLTYPAPTGLVTVDLTLRRGSRFVVGLMRRHAAASLGVARADAAAATAVTGGIVQTTTDADGNRYVIGSPSTTTAGASSLTRASSTSFPFFLGHEVNTVDEVQTVSFGGTVTGGTFTLTHEAATTTAIAYNATAATVRAALEALSTIGAGDVTVTGGPGPASYVVTFVGAEGATNQPQMTANGAALTGTAPTVSVSTTTAGVAPAAGDAFADLLGQYLGSSGEDARIVRR